MGVKKCKTLVNETNQFMFDIGFDGTLGWDGYCLTASTERKVCLHRREFYADYRAISYL